MSTEVRSGGVFGHAFGEANHLLYAGVGDDRMLFDGLRGDLFVHLPEKLVDTLDAERTGGPEAGAAAWRARLDDWSKVEADELRKVIAPLPEAPVEARVPEPAFFTIYPAAACNLACGYCYNDQGRFGGDEQWMTLPTAMRTMAWLEDSIRASDHDEVQVTLLGGEPSVNRPVTEYIARSVLDLDTRPDLPTVHLVVDSNGVSWSEELFEILTARPDRVTVELSIDGAADRHDAQRPNKAGEGTHHKTVALMRRLMDLGVAVRAVAVIPAPYALVETAEELLALGIRDFNFNQIEAHQLGTGERFERELSQWTESYLAYARWTLAQEDRSFRSDWDAMRTKLSKLITEPVKRFACNAGRKIVGVAPDGALAPCDRFQGQDDFALGHVSEGFDVDAWRRFQQTLEDEGAMLLSHPECGECLARWRCRGGCYARNSDSSDTHSIAAIDPRDCEYIRRKFVIDLWYLSRAGLIPS